MNMFSERWRDVILMARTLQCREPISAKPYVKRLIPFKSIKYFLGRSFPDVYFTYREARCMLYLLENQSNRKIAEIMGLSMRTVEFYVRNMRLKLGAKSRAHLIELVKKSDFTVRELD